MGSLFKAPKAPTALNPNEVQASANAQNTSTAMQNAAFNRVNQYGPYGSTTWAQQGTDPNGNPIFAQTTTANPEETAYRNQQRQAAFGAYSGGLSALGAMQPGEDPYGLMKSGSAGMTATEDPYGMMKLGAQKMMNMPGLENSQDAFDRAYGYASANLEPRMERARAAQEARLRNQGLDPTSESYKSQANDLALQHNEARNNLVTGIQAQLFNQGLQNRQQGLSEATGLFGQGQGEASRLYNQSAGNFGAGAGEASRRFGQQFQVNQGLVNGGRAGLVDPITTGTGAPAYNSVNVAGVDVPGIQNTAWNQQFQNYQQAQARQNAMIGGLGALGGTLLSLPMGGVGGAGASLGGSMLSSLMGAGGRPQQVQPYPVGRD